MSLDAVPRHAEWLRRILPATRRSIRYAEPGRSWGTRYYEVADARTGEAIRSVCWADARQGTICRFLLNEKGHPYLDESGVRIARKVEARKVVIRLKPSVLGYAS